MWVCVNDVTGEEFEESDGCEDVDVVLDAGMGVDDMLEDEVRSELPNPLFSRVVEDRISVT